MAIVSEVFGSCVGEIEVSVEGLNSESVLYYGLKYLRLTLAEKAADYLRQRLEMLPGIGSAFRCFGSD